MERKNVTYLKDIPELDQLDVSAPGVNLQRVIRQGSRGGMKMDFGEQGSNSYPPQGEPPQEGPSHPVPFIMPQLSCIEVLRHMQGCEICSKLYACDRQMYIIGLILLSILCILLLKRVLEL